MKKLPAAGLVIMVVGMAMVALGTPGQGNASAGGFILIGQFPVVFGTGTNGGQLAGLALALGILTLVLLSVLAWRLTSKVRGSSTGNA